MRIIQILLILFFLNAAISINSVAQDNFDFEKSKALVRQTFIDNFEELKKYKDTKFNPVNEMLSNPTLYKKRDASRNKLREKFIGELWNEENEIKGNVFDVFRNRLSLNELNKIYKEFINEKNIKFENTFKQIANENFNPVFDIARQEAVNIQANKMEKKIKLKNKEVCDIQNGDLRRKTLRNKLAERNNIDQYFWENREVLFSIIEMAIQKAGNEYKEQEQIVYNYTPDEAYTFLEIENEIIQRIENEKKDKIYPIFYCLKFKIKRLAKEKEKQQFLNYINNTKDKFINSSLTDHELKKEIQIKPKLHSEKDESDRIFEEKFTKKINGCLIKDYLEKAKAMQNDEFKNRVRKYYDDDVTLDINSKIQVMTRDIRKFLVDTLFQEDFANKIDTLNLSEKEEEIIKARKWNSNQKNDAIKTMAEQMITESNKQYIAEMNKLLKERIEAKYEEAISVYDRQMDIVHEKESEIMVRQAYRAAKKAGDKEKMFKIYLQEITYVWQDKNQEFYKGKYNNIFEGPKELIRKYVLTELNKAPEEKPIIIPPDNIPPDNISPDNDSNSEESRGGERIGLGGSGLGGGKGDGEGPGEGGGGGFRVRYIRKKLEELKDFEEPPLPPNFRIQLSYYKQTLSGHSSFQENFENGDGIGIRFDIKQSKSFHLSLYSGYSSFKYKHSDGNLKIIPLGFGFIYQIKPFKSTSIYFMPKFSLQNDLIFLKSDLLEQYGNSAKETYSQYVLGLRPGVEFIYRWKKFDIGMGIDYLVTIFPNSSINLPVVGKLYHGFVIQPFFSIYF